jgi:hypothetical protein
MSSTLAAVHRSRFPAVAAAFCTVAAGLTLGLPAAHAYPSSEWGFDEPGHYSWTVPDDVTVVEVELWGAAGGGTSPGGTGGRPAYVDALIDVTPGDTYEIYVGGTGDDRSTADGAPHAGGYNGGGDGGAKGRNGSGGGGGGATDIRYDGTALADRVVVAGGGGGSASSAGGTASDESGESGADYTDVSGGGGATTEAGGAGAEGSGASAGLGSGDDGVLGAGGAGQYDSACRYTGGGGGGGLYGGGGGGCVDNSGASGGGAGSSLVPEDGYVEASGDNPDEDDDGYALISLLGPDAPSAPSAVAGDSSATVSWTAPEFSGSMAVSGYTVTADPDGATCTTDGALSCVVRGLVNGTAYTFTVVASTEVGVSEPSAASGPVTPQVGTVLPSVRFPTSGAFLSSWTVLRSFGDPVATMTSSTPSVCRVRGATVVLLRRAGQCRIAVVQDGTAVASATFGVSAVGSGTAMPTRAVRFRGGSTYLTPASRARLTALAPSLRAHGTVVVVTGWVSGMRSSTAAQRLSLQRARVVASYLRSLGVHVTARYGPGAHWLGTSSRSRATDISWYAAPAPV